MATNGGIMGKCRTKYRSKNRVYCKFTQKRVLISVKIDLYFIFFTFCKLSLDFIFTLCYNEYIK